MRVEIFQWTALLAWAATGLASPELQPSCDQRGDQIDNMNVQSALPVNLVMSYCNGFRLEEATIEEMQNALESGKLTSVQLVHCYLARTFQTKPYLNSMMQENPDVFIEAAARDRERHEKLTRGPLHGIPFTIKDNIATKDKMETTAGSNALLGSRPRDDADVVKKLRQAGAIILGKAAMSEWADMRSSDYSEGYSARSGQCRSAYNLTVNPGGSSTGSGVGVAANAAAFSIGTETDGSVINPAMRNAIVGIKPTVGLTSRRGVIPESSNQDSVGTFGRTVRDAVLALDAIAGPVAPDKKGSMHSKLPDDPEKSARNISVTDWSKVIPKGGFETLLSKKKDLNGAKFGVPKPLMDKTDAETVAIFEKIFVELRDAGAAVYQIDMVNKDDLISPSGWDWTFDARNDSRSEYTYVKVDFCCDIQEYLGSLQVSPMTSLEHIIEYNRKYSGTEGGYSQPHANSHPAFASGQDGLEAALAVGCDRSEEYWNAIIWRQGLAVKAIDSALEQPQPADHSGHQNKKSYDWSKEIPRPLDALLVPLEPGQSYQIAAQAGYPMMTLPVGLHEESGMGIGLGLMQSGLEDSKLVKWGSAIEDALRCTPYKRQLPKWKGLYERNMPVPF